MRLKSTEPESYLSAMDAFRFHKIGLSNKGEYNTNVLNGPSAFCDDQSGIWDTSCGDRILRQLRQNYSSPGVKQIWLEIGHTYWGVPAGMDIFRKLECPVQKCKLVDIIEGDTVDARLFTQNVIFADVPIAENDAKRSQEEVWIIFILESPYATPNYIQLQGVFNWSMTYRRDSTIVTPYAKWIEDAQNGRAKKIHRNYAFGKSKKVAMFVSNCHADNNRLEYAKELSKFISVDIYGACGNLTCSRKNEIRCFNMLKRDYKFYLAFENANCRGYITEKLFINALR